ncbi:hypothetical protein GZH53_14630 [Flavihumibacter sp. R14]|nr:hypothetical protein [Flavihumibacter soli]
MKTKLTAKYWRYIIAIMLIILTYTAFAQEQSGQEKTFKNTIRYNLTGPALFGQDYIVFGYERLLKENQSASLNIGRMALPEFRLNDNDSISIASNRDKKGFHISADYRFYLGGVNRHAAPRGVYIGPYYSYNQVIRENIWDVASGTTTYQRSTSLDLKIHTVGFEIGYQFVFWNRLAVDLIMIGPGVANYDIGATFASDIPQGERTELQEKLAQALKNKFTGLSKVIEEGKLETDGNFNTWDFGYRYIVQVGFRF